MLLVDELAFDDKAFCSLASLSAARAAYMLGWSAMFCMLVALGRLQRDADTLGKATRLEGGLLVVMVKTCRVCRAQRVERTQGRMGK